MRLFRKGNKTLLCGGKEQMSISTPLSAPATMIESDISSSSSGLPEANLQPIVVGKGDGINDTKRSQRQSNLEQKKAKSSMKGLMSRMVTGSQGRHNKPSTSDDNSLKTPPLASRSASRSEESTRPVLITVNDGFDDHIPTLLSTRYVPSTKVSRNRKAANKESDLIERTTYSDLSYDETNMVAHFLYDDRSEGSEEDSLLADDASEMSLTTKSSFGTGISQSTGFTGTTGLTISTIGTNGIQSAFTELTGATTESLIPYLGAMSDEESTILLPSRISNSNHIATIMVDEFADIFLNVVRNGRDLLACTMDSTCNNDENQQVVFEDARLRTLASHGKDIRHKEGEVTCAQRE